mmetsp:Transcript_2202/g.6522  ORF Transcript_2202/g.6522 Transcript_2202/m.6522 type:complete len:222 (+) Transcript_2202:136-801(+)
MIVYALIARQKNVLAEHTVTSGNFPTITRVLLQKIPPTDSKMSYVYENHVFHYLVQDGITYLCLADSEGKRRVAFTFLEDIRRRFDAAYGGVAHTVQPFELNAEFSPTLERQVNFYNSDPASDDLSRVKSQLDDVKSVMVENVEKVLERGEKIELLVDKTDRLTQQAFKFESASRDLRSTMFWRKVKTYAMFIGLGGLVVFIVSSFVCGGVTYPRCRSSKS